ncbi:S41 family peptidase [Larkinella soli]|uniref:S41 family peptidase n=1 Tax=Larkinella soli TaxID=1770527 RepID=UPI000FFC1BF7|nr:S41 family peptidase [Larkinella soli]
MKTTLRLCLLLLLAATRLSAQTLTPEQLKEDFGRFRTALHEVHPEMYRYTPKTTFDSLFTAAEAGLNRPMTQHEFYVRMLPLLTALKDGHIKWIRAGQDEHYPFSTESLFPFRLYFVGNRAWVVGDYGGENRIPNGAEVTAINGLSTETVIRRLLPNMTFADGHTVNGKYEDLNHFFSGYYATFIGAPDAFEIDYRAGNENRSVRVSAVTLKQITAFVERQKPAGRKPFRLTYPADRTALMTIERFWDDPKEQDYRKFLEDSFREMRQKNIQNLVLDLRSNEGGEEKYGVLLYRYLALKPFRYYDHISVRQKKKYSFPAWTPKLYTKLRWLVVKKRGDGYVFTKQPGLKTLKPDRDAFAGKLYVLINGGCFSVTTEFSARAHADRRAVFLGQETGGGYEGNTSGIFTITQLPHSKIDLGIGMFGFHMANLPAEGPKDRGILPDRTVIPTADDILTGNDPVLKTALHMISQTGTVPARSAATN